MLGYTSKEQIENYLSTTIDSSLDAQVDEWIEQVEAYINTLTGRVFKADTDYSAKLYDGNNSKEIIIDEFVAIESITITDSNGDTVVTLTTDDIIPKPYNEENKNCVIIKPTVSEHFVSGTANISVSAKWGYSVAVPDEITFAATVLTAGIVNQSSSTTGEIKSETIGDYSVTFKDESGWTDLTRTQEVLTGLIHPKMYV